jgi:hypothetical protein
VPQPALACLTNEGSIEGLFRFLLEVGWNVHNAVNATLDTRRTVVFGTSPAMASGHHGLTRLLPNDRVESVRFFDGSLKSRTA